MHWMHLFLFGLANAFCNILTYFSMLKRARDAKRACSPAPLLLLNHLLRWARWVVRSGARRRWDFTADEETARKIKRWRLEGEFEVVRYHSRVGEPAIRKNRRRGHRGGEKGIRNEIWRADIWLSLFLEHASRCVSSKLVCVCVCILNVHKQMGHHLSSVDKSVMRKKKGKLPSVKHFLLSAVNLWTCESRACVGVLQRADTRLTPPFLYTRDKFESNCTFSSLEFF